MTIAALAASLVFAAFQPTHAGEADPAATVVEPHPLAALHAEADAVAPLTVHPAVRALIEGVHDLPLPSERTVHYLFGPEKAGYTQEQFDALPEEAQAGLKPWTPSPARYYATFYGSPLAYTRAFDLAAVAGGPDFSFDNTRVLDLGYGQIGQLRLLANAGAHAVGVDPDPILRALYAHPGDTGPFPPDEDDAGSVTLVSDVWPGTPAAVEAVGGGFDLFIARNLLKRGYIRPLADTSAYAQIDLGVEVDAFPQILADALAEGGLAMIYNLGAAPGGPGSANPDAPYNAAADIAQPWSRSAWEAAGFTVLAYDADDTATAIVQMAALGQLPEGENPVGKYFARYTLLRKD